MATYGIDLYGTTTYGAVQPVQYSASPFVGSYTGYGSVYLTWHSPSGSWSLLRLVRSTSGMPASENQGTVLFEAPAGGSPIAFADSGLTGGRFYYYALFVATGGSPYTWVRVATMTVLPAADYGYSSRLWELLPRAFRRDSLYNLTDDVDHDNAALRRFLSVFGFYFDVLHTELASLLDLNRVQRTKAESLTLIADELGVSAEPELGGRLTRLRVANAAYTHRLKGSAAGLETLINSLAGWDVDISVGGNRMLDSDQSTFAHPVYPDWRVDYNYAIHELVMYNNALYRAVQGNINHQPPGYGVSDAYWASVSDWDNTSLFNPTTHGQSTWGVRNFSVLGSNAVNDWLAVGAGIQSPTDPTAYSQNSLRVKNQLGQTADIGAQSVSARWGSPTVDSDQYLTDGLPLAAADAGKMFTASGYSASAFLSSGPTALHPDVPRLDRRGRQPHCRGLQAGESHPVR